MVDTKIEGCVRKRRRPRTSQVCPKTEREVSTTPVNARNLSKHTLVPRGVSLGSQVKQVPVIITQRSVLALRSRGRR